MSLKALGACALSLLLVSVSFTLAFGDFASSSGSSRVKVLGVGRIQSALPTVTVSSADKFALAMSQQDAAVTEQQVSELAEPITRELVLPVFVEVPTPDPEPVPDPEPTSGPEAAAVQAPAEATPATPATDANGWITTVATNYATAGDGILGKRTSSGEVTTATGMGVAHKSLPFGTTIEIYCPATGLSCTAVVNDRGPYDGRPDSLDFQMGVTAALGENSGWYTVQYRVV
jgi:hypothetical protein